MSSWRKPRVAKTVDQKYLPKKKVKKVVKAVTPKPDLTPKPAPLPVPKPVPKKTTVVKPQEVETKSSEKSSETVPEPVPAGRGKHPNSQANLKPFEPGVSGNPEGKKPGTISYKTIAEEAWAEMAIEQADAFNKKNKKAIKEGRMIAKTPEDFPMMKLLIKKKTQLAFAGKERSLENIEDRIFGKPVQAHKHGSLDDDPLVDAQIRAAEAEIDAWERMWEEEGVATGSKKHGHSHAQ